MTQQPHRPAQRPVWSLLRASEPQRARYATLLLAVMLGMTQAVFLLGLPASAWDDPGTRMPHLTFGPLVVAVFGFSLLYRRASLQVSRGLFLALALLALPHLVLLDAVMSRQGLAWVPFLGERTVLLGLGLLSPLSGLANVSVMALYVVTSWVQWVLQLRHLQPLADWSPGVTTLWGVLAGGLLLYRRRVDLELSEAARTRAEAEMLRSASRTLLVVRDGVNTPLQTLALGLTLLERHPERLPQVLPRLQRAHAQVRELMQHSAEVEDPLRTWDVDELSPDPHLELERLRAELARLGTGPHLH